MSEVTMLIDIDFIRQDSVREALTINVVTTGEMPTDQSLVEIISKEVKQHLSKYPWESPN